MRIEIESGGGPRRSSGHGLARALGVLLFALAALLAPGMGSGEARAQETEERIERLEREVERLRERLEAREEGDVERLRRQLDAVLRELEEMRLGADVVRADTVGRYGLAPAASKVYDVDQGVSIGGYGEILYENFSSEREDGTPSGQTDQIDALRAIVYVGYKFNDRILFNSEIEFEHGSTSDGVGSASVEFAYIDYRLSEEFGLRGGMLLLPMGFLNELHEPPTFLGTTRPETEQAIIPSTWRENGLGAFGSTEGFEFRAYLVNGLDAVAGGSSPAGGFSGSGLRGGRQKGAKAVAEDFAGVARLDYTGVLGLTVGTSAYLGESAQNAVTEGGETIGGRTFIWEGHGQYRARGAYLRGLVALATVDDVAELNAANGLAGSESIGERLVGGYLEAGYDVLRPVRTPHQLIPYVRYETLNTQDEVPEGFSVDPANDRTIVSLGAAWKPIPSVILKADYQIHDNEAEAGVDQFNVALGYLF